MASDSACSRCPALLRALMLGMLLCGMLAIWNIPAAALSPAHETALIGAPVHPASQHPASCWKPCTFAQATGWPWRVLTAIRLQTPSLPGHIVAPLCVVPAAALNARGQRVQPPLTDDLLLAPPPLFRLPASRIDPVAWNADATPQLPSARGLIFFSLPPPLSA